MRRLIYILAVVSLVIMASGCTSDQWASNKTYTGDGITFQYPGTWSENATKAVGTPSGSSSIAAVGTDEEAFAIGSISVTGLDAASIQDVLDNLVKQYKQQGYGSVKTVQVEGVNATMLTSTSKDASGFYYSIAFWTKNNKLYYAVYGSTTKDTETMERILGSLETT